MKSEACLVSPSAPSSPTPTINIFPEFGMVSLYNWIDVDASTGTRTPDETPCEFRDEHELQIQLIQLIDQRVKFILVGFVWLCF